MLSFVSSRKRVELNSISAYRKLQRRWWLNFIVIVWDCGTNVWIKHVTYLMTRCVVLIVNMTLACPYIQAVTCWVFACSCKQWPVVGCVCLPMQINCDVHVDTKHQTVQGVAFPLSQAAISELERLKAGKVNYVQLVCIEWTDRLICLEYLSHTHTVDIDCQSICAVFRSNDSATGSIYVLLELLFVDVTNDCLTRNQWFEINWDLKMWSLSSCCLIAIVW